MLDWKAEGWLRLEEPGWCVKDVPQMKKEDGEIQRRKVMNGRFPCSNFFAPHIAQPAMCRKECDSHRGGVL